MQAAIAGPMVLGLLVQTAANRDRGPVAQHLFWLLVMILAWMVGMVLGAHPSEAAHEWAAAVMLIPTCFMAPLFCLMMGHYARIEILEQGSATRWALLAPFVLFMAAFLSNDLHGLMADPVQSLVHGNLTQGVGPVFWAFQIWSNCAAFVGLIICIRTFRGTSKSEERRRLYLLGLAVTLPMAAHAAYLFRWLPFEAPLTPAALALTALFVVTAIQRYRLFEVQPVARRDVIEASSDGVIVADIDGTAIDLNPAAVAMLGGDRDDFCGATLTELLGELGAVEPAGAFDAMLEALQGGETPTRVEVETRDGRVFEASGGSPVDGSGTRAGAFVVLRDRSNERRTERMLQQTQKLESVGALAAGVAHEVNNPLAFVRANLAHLEYQSTLVEDACAELPAGLAKEIGDMPEVIAESIDGLDRIHDIVQGLLRFSRMPGRRTAVCDVNRVVRDALQLASLDRAASVRLECLLADALPFADASPDQLVQVVLNLFLNARHALKGRPDPAILASTQLCNGQLEIRIEDNGPGVAEELRARIFDPFFTTRATNEGTGLGLSIAFDIVRDHGGVLELENSPTGGACFIVRLPVGASAPSPRSH